MLALKAERPEFDPKDTFQKSGHDLGTCLQSEYRGGQDRDVLGASKPSLSVETQVPVRDTISK